MTTPTTPQDLPIPAGFTADAWQDDAPMPYRIHSANCATPEGSSTQPSKPPQSSSPTDATTTAACMSRRASISAMTPSQVPRPASWPPR